MEPHFQGSNGQDKATKEQWRDFSSFNIEARIQPTWKNKISDNGVCIEIYPH